tara:strand:+ start:1749 stop:2033 length:285 start_codon:yes stop_codon:yes gene_type:complete
MLPFIPILVIIRGSGACVLFPKLLTLPAMKLLAAVANPKGSILYNISFRGLSLEPDFQAEYKSYPSNGPVFVGLVSPPTIPSKVGNKSVTCPRA